MSYVTIQPLGYEQGETIEIDPTALDLIVRQQEEIESLRQQLAAALLWKGAVENELIVAGIWRKAHENDPKSAVNDAIEWNVQVARDPQLNGETEWKNDVQAAFGGIVQTPQG